MEKLSVSLTQYSVPAAQGLAFQLQHREAEFLMDAACDPKGLGQGGSRLFNLFVGSTAPGQVRTEPIHGLGDLTIRRAHDGQFSYVVAPDPARLKTVVANLLNASSLAHNKAVLLRRAPIQSQTQEHSRSKDKDHGR